MPIPIEIGTLAWGGVLLIVHVFAAAHVRTKQYGAEWNMGPRDSAQPPLNPLAGRLARAQANYLETFPVAIVALLGVVIAGRTSDLTGIGGAIWLFARLAYLPIYAAGIAKVRTVVFLISLIGLLMVLWPLLF